jgi:hypothetical protein
MLPELYRSHFVIVAILTENEYTSYTVYLRTVVLMARDRLLRLHRLGIVCTRMDLTDEEYTN